MQNGKNREKAVILLGPTATGKTAFGVQLAARFQAEIISVDSRQVYCGLDLGTGKDLCEYTRPDGTMIPYHLIDIVEPGEEYSLAFFLRDYVNAFRQIREKNKLPLIVGGTALFLYAILENYELRGAAPDEARRTALRAMSLPELHRKLREVDPESRIFEAEPENRTRIIRRIELAGEYGTAKKDALLPVDYLVLGLFRPRSEVHARIEARLDSRFAEQMIEEVQNLHDVRGVPWSRLEFLGLEYRQIALFLQGKITRSEMRNTLLQKIRQFAKRQDSWFRKFERDGHPIHWLKPDEFSRAESLIQAFLNGESIPAPEFRLADISWAKPPSESSRKNFQP